MKKKNIIEKRKEVRSYNVNYSLVKKFNSIFSEYEFFDLCRAVFCVVSYRSNRPELNYYLSLNEALAKYNGNGKKSINTYQEFKEIFLKIKKYYRFSRFVDENVPDFGDVYINYNEKLYPVFLGTGHDKIYSLMQTLYPSMKYIGCIGEMEEVLAYVETMIENLKPNNIFIEDSYYGDLFMPPEEYFDSIMQYYNKQDYIPFFLESALKEKNIEKTHFIFKDDFYYPIFNPSIIIDAYEQALKNVELKKLEGLSKYIIDYICLNNFDRGEEDEKISIHVGIFDNKLENKIIENQVCSTFVCDEKYCFLMISEEKYKGESIKKYIELIKEKHNSGDLQIIDLYEKDKQRIMKIPKEQDLYIISYDSMVGILSTYWSLKEKDENCKNSLLDVVYLLSCSDSFDEIVEFFKYLESHEYDYHSYDGKCGIYEEWKIGDKSIEQGAVDFGYLLLKVNQPEWSQFKKYRAMAEYYPFDNSMSIFNNPNNWIVRDKRGEYGCLISKYFYGYGGYIKNINNRHLFYVDNIMFISGDYKIEAEHLTFISDIILKYFEIYEDLLVEAKLFDKNVQIISMPYDYAKKVDNNGFTSKNRKYVYSDSMISEPGVLLIRFTVDIEKFMLDLEKTENREVECEFLKEFFSCLGWCNINLDLINKKLDKDKKEKKMFSTTKSYIEYYFSDKNIKGWPETSVYVDVRKQIAKVCKKSGIKQGIYTKEETKNIIRTIQPEMVRLFEEKIKQFDKKNLHEILLSYLAFYTQEKRTMLAKYKISRDENLSEESRVNTEKITTEKREEIKGKIRELMYLIESNLCCEHDQTVKSITKEEIEFLIAFSTWLVSLQDVSDMAHWGLSDCKIQITNEYTLDTIVPDTMDEETSKKRLRLYKSNNYIPKVENSNEYQLRLIDAFYKDTGYELGYINSLCYLLYASISKECLNLEIQPDVFEIDRKTLLHALDGFEELSLEERKILCDSINFLILDETQLKNIDNKMHDILPIWEREKRDQRFEVKPIVCFNDKIIYSPIILCDWMDMWNQGLSVMYPMYEKGLCNVCEVIKKQLELCQKQMEMDITKLFGSKQYVVLKEFDFYKNINREIFPQDLGGYDVIAIDTFNKVIWNLESKHIHMVGSIFEYANLQKSFFLQHKYDEKFQKRINFLKDNYKSILGYKQIPLEQYEIKDYMITNKPFVSEIKKINFGLITYGELKELIG